MRVRVLQENIFWSEKIFESFDYQIGWDGKYKNEMYVDGMYNWLLRFQCAEDETLIELNGNVVLIR